MLAHLETVFVEPIRQMRSNVIAAAAISSRLLKIGAGRSLPSFRFLFQRSNFPSRVIQRREIQGDNPRFHRLKNTYPRTYTD